MGGGRFEDNFFFFVLRKNGVCMMAEAGMLRGVPCRHDLAEGGEAQENGSGGDWGRGFGSKGGGNGFDAAAHGLGGPSGGFGGGHFLSRPSTPSMRSVGNGKGNNLVGGPFSVSGSGENVDGGEGSFPREVESSTGGATRGNGASRLGGDGVEDELAKGVRGKRMVKSGPVGENRVVGSVDEIDRFFSGLDLQGLMSGPNAKAEAQACLNKHRMMCRVFEGILMGVSAGGDSMNARIPRSSG